MKLLGTDHPFFRPLWLRIALVAFTGTWTALEFWYGNTGWGVLVGVFTALSVWGFFFDFDPDAGERKGGDARGD